VTTPIQTHSRIRGDHASLSAQAPSTALTKGLQLLGMISLIALAGCSEAVAPKESDTGSSGEVETHYDDADGDTILDIHEGSDDTDGDGLANKDDDDADGDTIKDRLEAGDADPLTLPIDSDSDGTSDYLDLDSDNNCVGDIDEKMPTGDGPRDLDLDGQYDYADADNDGDGIPDVNEIGADCLPPDTDGDGTSDYQDLDSDGDGVYDIFEAGTTEWDGDPVDTDGDGTPDFRDLDSDGDGFTDREESGVTTEGSAPRDLDGDGLFDFEDTDSDGDALSDAEERDTYGTDPFDPDSDGDGFSDGGEITAETDPLDETSVVDGIYVEVPERTEVEEVFDFTLQIQMGDIAFVIDTTGSMGSTANAMAAEFSNIVTTLASTIPDAEYAVGTYDDYACCGYGYASSSDKPFYMRQQVTDNVSQVQSVLSTQVAIHYGGDGPESGMEAILQGAAGIGYDMGCDGNYSPTEDVLPFLSSSTDPFGGGAGQGYSSSWTGGGAIGGFGFRDYALPVIVYATDYDLRDADGGYGVPGGCPQDAGRTDVIAAMGALGGYLIGVQVNNYTSTPYTQMLQLAADTSSYADTDGDGASDDPLAFKWTGSSTAFQTTITGAIEDLVSSIKFSKVALDIQGDDWGFVTGVDPEYFTDIDTSGGSQVIQFTLAFRGVVAATTEDQLFRLSLNVIGDDTVLLDTLDIIVRVPGNPY
jgi:hypothetical protein